MCNGILLLQEPPRMPLHFLSGWRARSRNTRVRGGGGAGRRQTWCCDWDGTRFRWPSVETAGERPRRLPKQASLRGPPWSWPRCGGWTSICGDWTCVCCGAREKGCWRPPSPVERPFACIPIHQSRRVPAERCIGEAPDRSLPAGRPHRGRQGPVATDFRQWGRPGASRRHHL